MAHDRAILREKGIRILKATAIATNDAGLRSAHGLGNDYRRFATTPLGAKRQGAQGDR
jgi:hypothetical protein